MYEYLEGTVDRQAPTSLVLDVNGVGYALFVPLGTAPEKGKRARMWVHQVVREDAHTLYGFADVNQRDLFRLLLSVRGVGPSVALSLLSGMNATDLIQAIQMENKGALTGIKGVGKKTADQILLDLGERVARLSNEHAFADAANRAMSPAAERDAQLTDAITALVSIGYKEKDAIRLVEKAANEMDEIHVESLIRSALHG
jgi:Holliday junction DNA helicase RuvA